MKGYFGGHDVNSLYPYAMSNNPMPIGNPVYFEGDIRKIVPKAFGFFNVKILAPDNIEVPILLTKTDRKYTILPCLTYWNLGRMVIYLRKDLICLQIL